MSAQIEKYNIGAFVLDVAGMGYFNVTSFQLSKQEGAITTCQVNVSDCTKQVNLNPSTYPKKMGSIKKLFETSQKVQNTGKLNDVKLEQYTDSGKKVWFTGKLCVITPVLDTSFGVQAGLQCYCMGKACMLMYQPSSDFIYVPQNVAKNPTQLELGGAFKGGSLQQAMWASSFKPDIKSIISTGNINAKDYILDMLNKALKQLTEWRKRRGQTLGAQQQDNLTDYFTCKLRLADLVVNQISEQQHPYVEQLIQDFVNGFNEGILFQALTSALAGRQRFLTYIPSSIKSGQDMLQIWPSYILRSLGGVKLKESDMLSCSISVNPQQHMRTPTCVYIRSSKLTAYQAAAKNNIFWKQMGSYILPGAKEPYRFKLLDVPAWILNVIVQSQNRKLSKTQVKSGLLNNSAQAQIEKKTTQAVKEFSEAKALLDRVAKTFYFNAYMRDKTAMINLAVNDTTLIFDQYIGQSIQFQLPVQAEQLGSTGYKFYGRVQDVRYTFQAAQSPKAKSMLKITCTISGVTLQDSPASALYKDDGKYFIYKRG